jgi:2-polyprenyl-3-methyl-5-hydroxy-6-metoxy-1,4-benzoquinol methylase
MQERIPFGKCPLCECAELADAARGDVSGHPLYHPSLERIVQWKRCTACGHVFTQGYFSDEALKLVFRSTHENQQAGLDLEKQRYLSAHIVEKVLPYASSGTWLDVGFGNGSLLFTAQEYGFTPLGLDLRAQNVKAMAALGIEAHCKDLSDLSMEGACAVISMADVLEHAPYPKKTLQAARGQLADNGVLFVSMPNMESMLWKAMDQQRANPYWAEIEHYHNFGRTRLYALLAEMGFEPVRYGISERYRAGMEVIARKA